MNEPSWLCLNQRTEETNTLGFVLSILQITNLFLKILCFEPCKGLVSEMKDALPTYKQNDQDTIFLFTRMLCNSSTDHAFGNPT